VVTDCPYHDLEPSTTVTVWIGSYGYLESAERACAHWHDTQTLNPIIDNIHERFNEALDRLADS
jgi:hypothetical protein